MLPPLWQTRFRWLVRLCIVSVMGLAFIVPGFFVGTPPLTFVLLGLLLFLPGAVYLTLVSLWHWKARYRGDHSDLWGALMLLETSGWFRLLYLFRHIIPDARGSGRYATSDEGVNADPLARP